MSRGAAPGGTDIDMDRVCRTCLREDVDMKPVFPTGGPDGASPSTMVTYCTQLEFIEGDGLPVHICRKCLDSVTNAFSFKLQAERADAKLRNYIAKKHLLQNTSIKEENGNHEFSSNIIIKTENKSNEGFESKLDDDFNMFGQNACSDDSDDFKPLKELKIIKKNFDFDDTKKTRTPVPCDLCNKTFISTLNLQNHKRKCHPGFVQCDICLRAFTKMSYLNRHKIASHSCETNENNKSGHKVELGQPIPCKLCDLTFSREDQLISHITLSHNGPRKRGRPSKKDILLNKLKLKKIFETMNIKTENEDYDMAENTEFFDSIPNSPLNVKGKVELYSETNEAPDNYCTFCCKQFRSTAQYDKHTEKHLTLKPSFCKLCDKTFKYVTFLKEHLKNHVSENFFNVDWSSKHDVYTNHEKLSGREITSLSEEDMKVITEHDIANEKYEVYCGEIKLESGNQTVSDSEDSESNIYDVENDDIVQKKTKVNLDKVRLKKNAYKLRKYKLHKCSLCDQSFSRSNHIMRHMSTHNFDYPDKCTVCEKVFPNKDLLIKHKRMQCENTSKAFQCGSCSLKFTYEMSLNKHILRYHKGESVSVNFLDPLNQKKDKDFVCPSCNKAFYRKEHLDKHMSVHLPSEKKFECPICQKKFNRKDNLRSHSRIHEPKEEIDSNCLCVYCGRSFSNSSNLIVHMRRHTGEKPYKCDICGKGFPRSSDLQCHRRTHTGEKPCLCTICGKGFSRSNKLVRHMRIHTGQRPYKCTFCDRAFTQSNDLTLHVRRHTGDKPYLCAVCGDRFIQGTALQAHRRMHGHYEQVNQNAPPSGNSVDNPNRNTVSRITPSTNTKSQVTVTSSSANEIPDAIVTISCPGSSRPTPVRSHNCVTNGVSSFLASSSLLLQNMSEVPNTISNIPLFSLQHYNQGYN